MVLHPNMQYRRGNPAKPLSKLCRVTLEPIAFLTLFSWSLASAVVQDQILLQACKIDLEFVNCTGTNLKEEAQVQPMAVNLFMSKNLADAVMAVVFALFVGPWTDKHGRRPILIAVSVGCFLTYLSLTVLNFITLEFSAWFYILPFGCFALVGGHVTFYATLFSYAIDNSMEQSRARDLVVLEAFLSAGSMTGYLSSSYIYEFGGGKAVMGIAAAANFVVVLWNVFALKERKSTNFYLEKGIFRLEHVQDLMKAFMKRRSRNNRGLLWTIMLALASLVAVLRGNDTVLFLYVRQHLQWNVRTYTLYNAASTIFLIFSNFVIMYAVQPKTRLADDTIAVLAFVSASISGLAVAFAAESWHMYLSIALSCVSGVIKPMCRTIMAAISRQSSDKEIGKLFSVTASLEAILPIVGISVYSIAYKATMVSFPGAFSLIGAVVMACCALSIAVVSRYPNHRSEYEEIDE